MSTISATLDYEGCSGLYEVEIGEILYLGVESRTSTIMLVTLSATYYTTGTLHYWTHVLNHSGYCFHVADRSNSINISKIIEIDEVYKIAFFDKHDRSKRCTMSRSGMAEVKGLLNQTNTSFALL